jgi:hypothetical protein
LSVAGKRLCKASEGSAALQERRTFERLAIYDQAFERRQHPKEYKELVGRMIAEAARMLHSKLKSHMCELRSSRILKHSKVIRGVGK